MKVFVSHSFKEPLIGMVQYLMRQAEVEPYLAEHDISVRETISEKILREIKNSDLFFALLTEPSINSNFVQQEIGAAVSAKIPILIAVEKGLENEITGFIYERDYIVIDREYTGKAYDDILLQINNMKSQLENKKKMKKQKFDGLVATVGIICLLALVASD
ncbi:MAG: toll/interleukin-1 receptor domain-containing protein [Candidatus Hatepunaea meridiana]|nr:toll/interleukin-1 receptor domain-containing protein [Candidatus Hatepunaea meridiana]